MNYITLTSLFKNKNLYYFSYFDEKLNFVLQKFEQEKNIIDNDEFRSNNCICFNIFKSINKFQYNFKFIYDVKILYQLAGYKFSTLKELGEEILGKHRLEKYNKNFDIIMSHLNSYKNASIDINLYDINELIYEDILLNFYKERTIVVMELYKRFDNKDVLNFYEKRFFDILIMLENISKNSIYVDENIQENNHHIKLLKNKNKLNLCFNPVGAKTGRLSFKKGTFNIYNFPRNMRKYIVSPKDYKIVQFDYKSFQPRLAIFSTYDDNFKYKFKNIDDIYSIFPGDREQNKISFLTWMFSNSKNEIFDQEAKAIKNFRNKMFYKVKKNGKLINMFGRYIPYNNEEQNVVFQNYITSLEVGIVLNVCMWLQHFFVDKKSKIIFPYHDAIVCYIHKDEILLINDIKNYMEFKSTNFDSKFPVEVKMGENFLFEG